MKNLKTIVGTLENIVRLPSSINGNPRYSAECNGVSFQLSPDSTFCYSLTNYENKKVKIVIGEHYGKTTLADIDLI